MKPPALRAGDSGFASTLARGLSLLAAFRPGEIWLSNAELARRTGLSRPTVSRLGATLVELGYLRQAPTSSYRLGARLLGLVRPLLSGMAFRQAARPVMKELADYARGAVSIAILEGLEAVFVETSVGPEPHPLAPEIGTASPLVQTAAGRALLSLLDESELTAKFEDVKRMQPELLKRFGQTTQREIERVRENGYALSLGDFRQDVHAIGVPLGRTLAGEVLSMNCGIPLYRLRPQNLVSEIAPRVVAAANTIRALLALSAGPALNQP